MTGWLRFLDPRYFRLAAWTYLLLGAIVALYVGMSVYLTLEYDRLHFRHALDFHTPQWFVHSIVQIGIVVGLVLFAHVIRQARSIRGLTAFAMSILFSATMFWGIIDPLDRIEPWTLQRSLGLENVGIFAWALYVSELWLNYLQFERSLYAVISYLAFGAVVTLLGWTFGQYIRRTSPPLASTASAEAPVKVESDERDHRADALAVTA